MLEMEKLNKLSKVVIGEAIEIHKELGPGLLESAYQACLFYSLTEKGLNVEKEKPMPIKYKNVELDCGQNRFVSGEGISSRVKGSRRIE